MGILPKNMQVCKSKNYRIMKKLLSKIGIVVIVLSSVQCKSKEETNQEALRPVKYAEVTYGLSENTTTLPGIAKAGEEIELSFRESGTIVQLNVVKGKKVKKSDVIAILDNLETQLTYEKTLTDLNGAKSAMNTDKSELNRIKVLYEKGNVSLKEYQQSKNNYQRSLSQYESAKRNLAIQQDRLKHGVIVAPHDGVIAKTNRKVNERIQMGEVLAVLNAGKSIDVRVEVTENSINKISTGKSASVTFSALGGKEYTGTIIEVSPITSANATTYPVDIRIDEYDEKIKPGMAASVRLHTSTHQYTTDAILVPLHAVGEDENGNYVFIVESDDQKIGVVKKQTVLIENYSANGFLISDGLSQGQLIAIAGLNSLLDGQKVKLQ